MCQGSSDSGGRVKTCKISRHVRAGARSADTMGAVGSSHNRKHVMPRKSTRLSPDCHRSTQTPFCISHFEKLHVQANATDVCEEEAAFAFWNLIISFQMEFNMFLILKE